MIEGRSAIAATHFLGVGMNGECGLVERRTQAATFRQDMVQVGREAVGNVDHGMDVAGSVHGERLLDSRLWSEVPARQQAATEGAGHEDRITGLGTASADGAAPRRLADRHDGDHQWTVPRIGIAANQVNLKTVGELAHARVETFGQDGGPIAWQRNGDQGRARCAGHGRDIGKIDAERLVTDGTRAVLLEPKMPAVHEHVGGDEKIRTRVGGEDRTIVADSEFGCTARTLALLFSDPVNEGEFSAISVGFIHEHGGSKDPGRGSSRKTETVKTLNACARPEILS